MATYTIRPGFTIAIGELIYSGGESVELNDIQFELNKHKLEGVEPNQLPQNLGSGLNTQSIIFDDTNADLVEGVSEAALKTVIEKLDSRLDTGEIRGSYFAEPIIGVFDTAPTGLNEGDRYIINSDPTVIKIQGSTDEPFADGAMVRDLNREILWTRQNNRILSFYPYTYIPSGDSVIFFWNPETGSDDCDGLSEGTAKKTLTGIAEVLAQQYYFLGGTLVIRPIGGEIAIASQRIRGDFYNGYGELLIANLSYAEGLRFVDSPQTTLELDNITCADLAIDNFQDLILTNDITFTQTSIAFVNFRGSISGTGKFLDNNRWNLIIENSNISGTITFSGNQTSDRSLIVRNSSVEKIVFEAFDFQGNNPGQGEVYLLEDSQVKEFEHRLTLSAINRATGNPLFRLQGSSYLKFVATGDFENAYSNGNFVSLEDPRCIFAGDPDNIAQYFTNPTVAGVVGSRYLGQVKQDDEEIYQSPELNYINGAEVVFAHGWSDFDPTTDWYQIQAWAVCTSNQNGWVVGERALLSRRATVSVDADNIYLQIGANAFVTS